MKVEWFWLGWFLHWTYWKWTSAYLGKQKYILLSNELYTQQSHWFWLWVAVGGVALFLFWTFINDKVKVIRVRNNNMEM